MSQQQPKLFTYFKKQTNLVETIGEDIEDFSDDELKSKQNSKGPNNKADTKSVDQNKNLVNQKTQKPIDSPKKNPPQNNNQNTKKNIPSNEPIDLAKDEYDPAPKRVQWYWRSDNGVWVSYDPKMTATLEESWQAMQESNDEQHKVSVDKQRFVDLDFMLQRRYDDPSKTRPVKREGPSNNQPKPQNNKPIQPQKKPDNQNQGNLLNKLKQAQNTPNQKYQPAPNDVPKNVKPVGIKQDAGSDTDEMDDTQVKNAISQLKPDLKRKFSDVVPAKAGSGSDTDPLDQTDIQQKFKSIKAAQPIKDTGSDTDEMADTDIKHQLSNVKGKQDNGSDTDEMDEDTIKTALKPQKNVTNNKPITANSPAKYVNNNNTDNSEILWFWLSDNAPVPYDANTSQRLEKAYKIKMANAGNAKNLTVKVDDQRYVDIQKMMQCRFDDPLKMRKVLRRTAQEQQKQLDFQQQKQNHQKQSNNKQGTLDKTFLQLQNKFKQQINTNTAKSSGQWFWQNDASEWEPYSADISQLLESNFLNGKSTVKIDQQRYVDLGMMLQRRYDNPNRSRYVTRRTKSGASPAKPAANKPNFQQKNTNNNMNNNFNKPNNNNNNTTNKPKAPIDVDSEEEIPLKLKKSKSATITPPAESTEDLEDLTAEMEEQIEASIQYHNIKAHLKGSDDGESSDEEAEESNQNNAVDPQKALELKRQHYKCGNNYLTLEDIPTLVDIYATYSYAKKAAIDTPFMYSKEMNSKVSLLRADITALEIDAIVNAAKPSLLGGGGIDGAIHAAAGKGLLYECMKLGGCEVGSAKITTGHKLPAKYVVHTVGPIGENKEKLKSCYLTCLDLAKEKNIKSIAFCGISTGIYGYPKEKAAHVALRTVRNWLDNEANMDEIDRVIFCVFLDEEEEVYSDLMPYYFPSMEAQDDD